MHRSNLFVTENAYGRLIHRFVRPIAMISLLFSAFTLPPPDPARATSSDLLDPASSAKYKAVGATVSVTQIRSPGVGQQDISGNAGIAGVTLSYTYNGTQTATADGSGNYSFYVSGGWSGTVTPSKANYTFSPPSRTYTNVVSIQIGQNYTVASCTAIGSGTVNWSAAFNGCPAGAKFIIPTSITVVLDSDISIDGDLEVQTGGALDPNGRSVTLTGGVTQTLTGDPLTFHRLTINKANAAKSVTIAGKLKVTDKLTVTKGQLIADGANDYADVEIETEGVLISNNDISVSGHFTNSGTLNTAEFGITFDGGVAQNLTLNVVTSFDHLTVLTGTTLIETVTSDNANVTGTPPNITNNGVIRKTQPVASATQYYFGLAGNYAGEALVLDVMEQGTLSALQVDRIDGTPATAPAGLTTPVYWTLTPTGGGYTTSLTLPHDNVSNPLACRSLGGDGWDCAATSSSAITVTRAGVTALGTPSAFSDWAVFDANLMPLCTAVSPVTLDRQPDGDALTGDLLRLSAAATGTLPFTYTWTVDGAPAGPNASLFAYTFAITGQHTVAVSVTNACGTNNATTTVTIKSPAPGQGNLSKSSKLAARTSVSQGDTITYTILLRNVAAVTATTRLTDPLPAHTTYVAGSLSANTGAASFVDSQVQWHGEVVSGTPVLIAFAVSVTDALPVDTAIRNFAQVDDGVGHVFTLTAAASYQPAFDLSINDGARFTRIPTVTLAYHIDSPGRAMTAARIGKNGAMDVRFANDAGFLINSGWMSATTPYVHADWLLAPEGDRTVPRTVYAQFRLADGTMYGPVNATIFYDPDPPAVVSIQVISTSAPSLLAAVRSVETVSVLLRIASVDTNSGASVVTLSNAVTMTNAMTYTVQGGSSITVPWQIPGNPLGEVSLYAQVEDRAGNHAPVSEHGLLHRVILPMIVKH